MPIAFYILGAITLAGAAAAMGLRNLIHCVLALSLGFVGIALLFLQLGAQFVGFTQVLVYVGAVAILAVFAIMMTRSAETPAHPALSASWLTGLVTSGGVFAALAIAIVRGSTTLSPSTEPTVSVQQIGDALMHRFALPLEIMGLLLTAALVGAVIIAMPREGEPQ